MNLVDSSGWLAYFADEPAAKKFEPALTDTDSLIVPAVVLFEVLKVMLRETGENTALQAWAAMLKGTIVDVTPQVSAAAARLSLKHGLPMADSMILATAQLHDAVIWTQDAHFKQLPNVKYFPKRADSPQR